METKTFRKGEMIIEKDSHGTCAYVIESGRVEISNLANDKKVVLAILGEKQIFGEMGLVEDKPRSAKATAIEDVRLSVLTRERFNELFEKNPKALLPIIKSLFEKLRTANNLLINKDAPEFAEPSEYSQSDDSLFVVLSGLNEVSSESLGGSEMKIGCFPFKVGREHELGKNDVLSDNDLYLNDFLPFKVSRNHFLIDKKEGRFIVFDRGSHLGTIVNDKRIDVQKILNKKVNKIIVGSKSSPFVFKLEIR
ncbi:MAG: cyclic nucleotide-binding domain-containing protein [Planctomycetota bacterium]|jgi:CRP-like cAMP-binding protein